MDYEKYKEQTINEIMKRIKEIIEEEVEATIDDMKWEAEHYKEKFEDLEKDVEDNYKPISTKEMYGIDDSDFLEIL